MFVSADQRYPDTEHDDDTIYVTASCSLAETRGAVLFIKDVLIDLPDSVTWVARLPLPVCKLVMKLRLSD